MPSALPLPTVPDLEAAFHASVASERENEDAHLGSIYDRWSGVGALCMRRIAERDQGEARAIFFDTATDDRLDDYIEQRFGATRVQDAPGIGTALLVRPSGTSGRFLKGTRIQVSGGSGALHYWAISDDIDVGSDVQVTVPVEATVNGPDGQISIGAGVASIADPLWDNTWTVTSLTCAPGTVRQQDPAVRAAIRQARLDARPGYPTAIINAMTDAGASVVALYASNFLGDDNDVGLNRIYVGDSGYESTAGLLTACRLKLPKVAVFGTSAQVLPMTNSLLFVKATVRLWTSPEKLNQVQAQSDAVAAIAEYFARRDNAFLWSAAAMRAAVMKAVPNVHSVTVAAYTDATAATPVAEPVLSTLFDASPLPRYRVADWSVQATIAGPT